MKKILVILFFINVCMKGFCSQQNNSSAKQEIKKDAKEVAAGAKQAWHGVKEGGRTVGHKTKHVTKAIGKGVKKTAKDVKKEVKK